MRSISIILLALTFLQAPLPAADFPHYRGDGTGAAPDPCPELVDAPGQAKLVWASTEEFPPMGWNLTKVEFPGGFSVPVVAGGKVYLVVAWPSGPELEGNYKNKPVKRQVDADEIVYCLDAKTGKTLWKTVSERTGWNYQAVYPSDGQITPCVEGGKVIFMGTTGRAYCLDAETGDQLWQQQTGTQSQAWALYKQRVLAGKDQPKRQSRVDKKYIAEVLAPRPPANPEHGGSGGGGFNATPRVFGDLAVFNAMGEGVAFGLEKGEERWRVKFGNGPSCSIIRWTHGDRELLIGSKGCFDPATGKKLWGFPTGLGGAYQGSTWAIEDDFLVGSVPNLEDKKTRPKNAPRAFEACFKMSPKGAEEIWRLPYATTYMSPVIHRGHVYLHTKVRPDKPLPEGYQLPDTINKVKGADALVCVELATGKVKAIGLGLGGANSQGTCPFAMGGRIITYAKTMFDTAPQADGKLRRLGDLPQPAFRCTFPTGADGFLYLRPKDRSCLLQCWDLRQR